MLHERPGDAAAACELGLPRALAALLARPAADTGEAALALLVALADSPTARARLQQARAAPPSRASLFTQGGEPPQGPGPGGGSGEFREAARPRPHCSLELSMNTVAVHMHTQELRCVVRPEAAQIELEQADDLCVDAVNEAFSGLNCCEFYARVVTHASHCQGDVVGGHGSVSRARARARQEPRLIAALDAAVTRLTALDLPDLEPRRDELQLARHARAALGSPGACPAGRAPPGTDAGPEHPRAGGAGHRGSHAGAAPSAPGVAAAEVGGRGGARGAGAGPAGPPGGPAGGPAAEAPAGDGVRASRAAPAAGATVAPLLLGPP